MHFTRMFHLALFETRMPSVLKDYSLMKDTLLIVFGVVPSFIIGLRFWTGPAYLKYTLKINSVIAPFHLIIIFGASHIDVSLLGMLVLVMNVYVFWYHIDPPEVSDIKYHKRE